MKLTKKHSLILVTILLIIAIWYFIFKKKSPDESNYDTSWVSIGDDFFVPNSSSAELAKKYIDGTISHGILLNEKGEYRGGENENYEVEPSRPGPFPGTSIPPVMGTRKKLIPYPKDKGFVKNDSRGHYFYFEPLSDFQMQEITRLTDLKNAAYQAQRDREAADREAFRLANEASKAQAEAAKTLALQKAAEANKAAQIASQSIAAAQQRSAELNKSTVEKQAAETSKRTKVIAGIVLLIIGSVVGFFVWKNKHKTA